MRKVRTRVGSEKETQLFIGIPGNSVQHPHTALQRVSTADSLGMTIVTIHNRQDSDSVELVCHIGKGELQLDATMGLNNAGLVLYM